MTFDKAIILVKDFPPKFRRDLFGIDFLDVPGPPTSMALDFVPVSSAATWQFFPLAELPLIETTLPFIHRLSPVDAAAGVVKARGETARLGVGHNSLRGIGDSVETGLHRPPIDFGLQRPNGPGAAEHDRRLRKRLPRMIKERADLFSRGRRDTGHRRSVERHQDHEHKELR